MIFLNRITKLSSLFLAIIFSIGAGFILQVALAGWQEPAVAPPGGNVPGVIWNSKISNLKQDASFNISGTVQLGSEDLVLKGGQNPENLIYGLTNSDYEGNFLLFQTKEGAGEKMLLEVDNSGNLDIGGMVTVQKGIDVKQGDISSDQNINAGGCIGPVFAGLTGGKYKGDLTKTEGDIITILTGYKGAHDICTRSGLGHVCSTAEILESIKCNVGVNRPTKNAIFNTAGIGWINNGPPAFTANANDCQGWTAADTNSYGAYWAFDATSGGQGWLSLCDWPKSFACCK